MIFIFRVWIKKFKESFSAFNLGNIRKFFFTIFAANVDIFDAIHRTQQIKEIKTITKIIFLS